MHTKRHVLHLKCPLTTKELKYMDFIFVDDTYFTVIAREDEIIYDVIHIHQQDTLYWGETFELTGGDLKPVK